jgi:hypothetical protein
LRSNTAVEAAGGNGVGAARTTPAAQFVSHQREASCQGDEEGVAGGAAEGVVHILNAVESDEECRHLGFPTGARG